MKINKNELLNFIKYISLKGGIEITEAIFDFKKNKIMCLAHKDASVFLRALLNCSCEEFGELGIDDLKFLKGGINLFNEEEVTIELDKNKLVLTTDKKKLKLKLNLRNCEYILTKVKNQGEINKLDLFENAEKESKVNLFTLTNENREKIIKHYNSIKSEKVILEGNGNELSITLENNENELIDTFEIEKIDDFKVKVSKFFIELLSVLDGDVKVSMVTGKGIYVNVNEEFGNFEYLILPLK